MVLLLAVMGALVLFILNNSLLNGQESRAVSLAVLDDLKPLLRALGLPEDQRLMHIRLRKCAHIIEFALLGLCLAAATLAIRRHTRRWHLSTPLLAALVLAVLDEYIQTHTGRRGSVQDIIIDFAGTLVGFLPALVAALLSLRPRPPRATSDA